VLKKFDARIRNARCKRLNPTSFITSASTKRTSLASMTVNVPKDHFGKSAGPTTAFGGQGGDEKKATQTSIRTAPIKKKIGPDRMKGGGPGNLKRYKGPSSPGKMNWSKTGSLARTGQRHKWWKRPPVGLAKNSLPLGWTDEKKTQRFIRKTESTWDRRGAKKKPEAVIKKV